MAQAREGRRIRCRKAVEATFNWEHQAKGLLGIYTRLRLQDDVYSH
jgi:hypothetical protein